MPSRGDCRIYVLKNNTVAQMEQSLLSMRHGTAADPVNQALQEAEEAAGQVMTLEESIELSPQNAYSRRLQHEVAQRYKHHLPEPGTGSRSAGCSSIPGRLRTSTRKRGRLHRS